MVALRPLEATLDDVCFCHWPVARERAEAVVPDWLAVETADGDAWVSAIAATVERVDLFGVTVSRPAELLTVRTYVRGPSGQRGVAVLALFCDDPRTRTAVSELFHVAPGDAVPRVLPTSERRRVLDAGDRRLFECRYEATGEPVALPPDSLASFLVDRQRYFAAGPLGTRLVGSIGHDPWRLDRVDAAVTGAPPAPVELSGENTISLTHHSPGVTLSLAPPAFA
ncbi:DUF2071 domain-containing protein [Haloarcula salina]|uniref:DUF2071 domain-containing protein n=1 Tax=Haloarcula salina TaxID=1429914 RepID=UPI003C6FC9B8